MLLRALFLLVGGALLLGACDSGYDAPGEGQEARPLLPLTIGTTWVFAFENRDADGALLRSGLDTARVVSDTTIAGERWAKIESREPAARACIDGYYTLRADGLWRWEAPADAGSEPYLQYPYPAESGDTFFHPDSVEVTVVATDEPLETPYGTVSSYHYDLAFTALYFDSATLPIADPPHILRRVLAPGTGFVLVECDYLRTNEEGELVLYRDMTWTLVSFEEG